MWMSRDGQHPVQVPDDLATDYGGRGFVEVPAPPNFHPATEILGWRWDGWHVEAMPLDRVRSRALAALADERWRRETAGVVFGGAVLQTDRESRANLMGAALRAQMAAADGEAYSLRWKTAAGFVDLDGPAVIAAAKAAEAHVRACFAREADLSAAIDVAALDPDNPAAAVLAIDITAGWPE